MQLFGISEDAIRQKPWSPKFPLHDTLHFLDADHARDVLSNGVGTAAR